MTQEIDALHITQLQQDAHTHLNAGDLRSAMPFMEESKIAEQEFIANYGERQYAKLKDTISKLVEITDTSIFVALTGEPWVEDYGEDIAGRILEAVYAAMIGVFDESYFAKVETFVSIDPELEDPFVLVRDLDEKRNGHYSRLVQEFVSWAYTEAVAMVEAGQ